MQRFRQFATLFNCVTFQPLEICHVRTQHNSISWQGWATQFNCVTKKLCNRIRWNLPSNTKLPHNWIFFLSHNSIVWPDIFGHFLASLRTKISSEVAIRKSLKFCTYDSFCGENCNSGHEVMRKNRKNRFYRFFSRSPLQMFFKLIILMGNNLNNLYLNGQVIWYGGSRYIEIFAAPLLFSKQQKSWLHWIKCWVYMAKSKLKLHIFSH